MYKLDFNTTTFITAGIALVVTPVISLLTSESRSERIESIWKARHSSEEERTSRVPYHIIPTTRAGRFGFLVLVMGFGVFLTGVLLGSNGAPIASTLAVTGMVIYFGGGLIRAFSD